MRRRLLALLSLAVLLGALVRPSPADPAADAALAVLRRGGEALRRTVTDNGTIVLIYEDHSAPVASVQIWVGTGAIHEDEYLGSGLSHIIEHMIFKGTPTRGPVDITREINDAGGYINAYTSFDRTVFYTDLPSRNWRVGLDVLVDALRNAAFPEEEWAKERDVVLREIAMRRDQPGTIVGRLLWATAYRVHPYRVPVIGYVSAVSEVTREHLAAFARRHYVPDNMIVVVAGDVVPDEVEAAVDEALAGFERRARAPVNIPPEPPQMAARFVRETGPFNVARLEWAYHATDLGHPDTPALDLLASVAGHGRSSRLVREIKERRGLVHSISAWSYTPKYPGMFGISATYDAAREEDVLDAIGEVVAALCEAPVSEAELARARRQVIISELGRRQTVKGLADSFAAGEFYAADPRYDEAYIARLGGITPADLQSVAQRYLREQTRTIAILAPESEGPAAEAAVAAVTAGETERIELANGVPVIVRRDARLPFVWFSVAVRGGLLSELDGEMGVTRLMANLLTRGTATRGSEQIAEEVESMGASLSAFSGYNSFGLTARCLSPDAPRLARILADCLLNSRFPEDQLERQRSVQLAAIAQQQERPMHAASEELRGMLFAGHPYAGDPLGTEETVTALTREHVVAQYGRLLRADRLAVSVFGDVDADGARELLEEALADLPAGVGAAEAPPPAAPQLPSRSLRREPREQAMCKPQLV